MTKTLTFLQLLILSILFAASAIAKKLITIVQWGTGKWTSMHNTFMGCTNLIGSSTIGAPDLSSVTDMSNMFKDATALSTANYDATLIGGNNFNVFWPTYLKDSS